MLGEITTLLIVSIFKVFLEYENRWRFFFHFVLYWGIHYLEKKVAWNYKQQNKYFDNFHIIKIRQNLNHFVGSFYQT